MFSVFGLFLTWALVMARGQIVPSSQRDTEYVVASKGTYVRVSPALYYMVRTQETFLLILFVPFVLALGYQVYVRIGSGRWSVEGEEQSR